VKPAEFPLSAEAGGLGTLIAIGGRVIQTLFSIFCMENH
jgi:hypothetical protein